ncbi:hypothetical protein KDN34_12235 [Shewanella yunxiaonensis]|uniref:Uncharacterized protein n=1 Tax=Shewanella yunxiaonensis TaxID=2829809 RepID=A0ABX7YQF1_9GAMM|nr:hypothetical protein [Shewanella yunxiaonensis]QUN04993.1 hypothetical protein KDN34_12235 [Shewanella yunxiaonensis]
MNEISSNLHLATRTSPRKRPEVVPDKVVVKKTTTCDNPQQPLVSKEELAYIFSLFR